MITELVDVALFPDLLVQTDEESTVVDVATEAGIVDDVSIGWFPASTVDYDYVYLRLDLFLSEVATEDSELRESVGDELDLLVFADSVEAGEAVTLPEGFSKGTVRISVMEGSPRVSEAPIAYVRL